MRSTPPLRRAPEKARGPFWSAAWAAAILLSAETAFAAQPVRLGGSGLGVAVLKSLSGPFQKANPAYALAVAPSLGSSGGIQALLDGKLDASLSAQPLRDSERARGLSAVELGRTPFVFAVARGSAADAVSLVEVAEIFEGSRLFWSGGKPLRLVLRPPGDADTALLKTLSPRMARAVDAALGRPGMIHADTDQDAAEALEKIPGAFGATSLAQILSENRRLKPLALDGVAPTPANLRSGVYRFAKPLFLVVRSPLSSQAGVLLRYLLSPGGQAELERVGVVPPLSR